MKCNSEDFVRGAQINTQVYFDEEVFEQELDDIFYRTWVFVAHESEIPEPGDYKTTKVGLQPVIVVRDAEQGDVQVLVNRCRHRAATICQHEYGSANFFRCAYHGWTYSNNGDLVGLPFQDGYSEELNKDELGLQKLPRVDSYNGFIFASFNPDVEQLVQHLAAATGYLDRIASLGPEGIELSAGAHKYTFDGNWKLQLENTIDPYHLAFTHRSYFEVQTKDNEKTFNFKHMHANEVMKALGNGHSTYHLSTDLGIGALPFNLIIFPNIGFVGSHLRVIQPVSVNRTIVHLYPIMIKGVGDEVNQKNLRDHESFYGSGSFGSPDDVEVAFDRVIRGVGDSRQANWLSISRGQYREKTDEEGLVMAYSNDELSIRELYKQWKVLMEASS